MDSHGIPAWLSTVSPSFHYVQLDSVTETEKALFLKQQQNAQKSLDQLRKEEAERQQKARPLI